MKPYGIPRHPDVENPDLVDLRVYALKSSRGRLPSLGGDRKNSIRKSSIKRNTRVRWKRKARKAAKDIVLSELKNESIL